MNIVEYTSNNSGGSWWLEDEDWFNLEKAGWKVDWAKNWDKTRIMGADENGRWLGCLAKTASKENVSLKVGIAEWEDITGNLSNELGCSCCGTPHSFTLYNDDKYVDSYSPEYPSQGDRY